MMVLLWGDTEHTSKLQRNPKEKQKNQKKSEKPIEILKIG